MNLRTANESRTSQNNRRRSANTRRADPLKGLRLALAPYKRYLGPCHLEKVTNERAVDEWVVALDPPFGDDRETYLDTPTAFDAAIDLARLGVQVSSDVTEHEARDLLLKSLQFPSRITLQAAEDFVRTHGLLQWKGYHHTCEWYALALCNVPHPYFFDDEVSYLGYDEPPKYELGIDGWATQPEPGRNRYQMFHAVLDHIDDYPNFEYVNAVGWMLWELHRLRRAWDLWQALRNFRATGDIRPAVFAIRQDDDKDRRVMMEEIGGIKTSRQRNSYWVGLGYARLEILLNQHLKLGNLLTEFSLNVEGAYFPGLSRLTPGALRRTQIGVRMEPTSVLSALWMRLAAIIQAEERTCPQCGKSLDGTKADKVYCDDVCRMRFNRRR